MGSILSFAALSARIRPLALPAQIQAIR